MLRKVVFSIATVVATIVIAATLSIFARDIAAAEAQERFYKSAPYDYVYEYYGELGIPNSYYNLTDSVSVLAETGRNMRVTILMEKQNVNYTIFPSVENANKALLSNNLSKTYELEEYSCISIMVPSITDTIVLDATSRLDTSYMLFGSSFNRYSGIIIIGYQEIIAENLDLISCTFLDEQDDVVGQYSLKAIHSKEASSKSVMKSLALNATYAALLSLLELLILFAVVVTIESPILKLNITMGMPLAMILRHLLTNGIIELVSAICVATLAIVLYCWITMAIIPIALIISMVIELSIVGVGFVLFYKVVRKRV